MRQWSGRSTDGEIPVHVCRRKAEAERSGQCRAEHAGPPSTLWGRITSWNQRQGWASVANQCMLDLQLVCSVCAFLGLTSGPCVGPVNTLSLTTLPAQNAFFFNMTVVNNLILMFFFLQKLLILWGPISRGACGPQHASGGWRMTCRARTLHPPCASQESPQAARLGGSTCNSEHLSSLLLSSKSKTNSYFSENAC